MASDEVKVTEGQGRRDFLKKAGIAAVTASMVVVAGKASAAKGKHYAMVIDLRRCYGCRACTVACKAEYGVPVGVFRACVKQKDVGKYPNAKRHFLPILCNHCSKPPCVEVCPVKKEKVSFMARDGSSVKYEKKATFQRPDGSVLVDYERCIGCHACVDACPYNARFVDPFRKAGGEPTNNTVGKCTYCLHRVSEGLDPACVQTCPARARIFGDINDKESEVSKLLKDHKVKVLLPDEKTKPNTYYIELQDNIYEKGVRFRDEIV